MRKIVGILGLGASLLAGLYSGTAAAADCVLSLGWVEYQPYLIPQKDGAPTGLDAEMAKAVAEAAGCQLKFVERSWAATLKGMEAGEIDMGMGASRTAEREAYAFFAPTYRQEQIRIVVKAGEAAKNPLQDIGDITKTGLRIGAMKESYFGDHFAELAKKPEFAKLVDYVTDDGHNLNKVVAGRIFGFLADPLSVPPLAKAKGAESQIEFHPLLVVDDPVHMMFSKKSVSPEVFAKIEAATKELKASGKLDAIVAKYASLR